jgi:iron complex outermembrane receptor protein
MKQKLARMICTTLALGFLATSNVQAAEKNTEFSFDQVVITALRTETKELETPASVTVKTGEELKATGALTVVDALQFIDGINMYSQGPYGQSAGRMSSELVIRGAKKGTLIMVNGAPINMNGLFQLDNILLENVEKVEVVRGAGSVMYGSEAFGGVINIITKKQVSNSISSSIGSLGRHSHSLNLQAGKFGLSGSFIDGGETKKVNETAASGMTPAKYTNYTDLEKISLNSTYRFNDKLLFTYTYSEDDIDKEDRYKAGDALYRLYNDKERVDRFILQYQDEAIKANLYGTFRELDYYTKTGTGGVVSNALNTNLRTSKYGLDTNKSWDRGRTRYLSGLTLEQEEYEQNVDKTTNDTKTGPFDRNVFALYTQATHEFDDARKLILGVRGQKTEAEQGKEYKQLLPQVQYNQRVGDDSSWFVNIGKAFRLPTLTEMYVTTERFIGNPELKPQSGWTYETGWKKQTKAGALRAAFFVMDMKSYIEQDGAKQYQNFDTYKNEGIEVSWEQKLSETLRYTVGGAYGNPRAYYNGQWERMYSRLQGTLALRYTQDKLMANLSATYMADRANDATPAFPVSLMVNYKVKPETTVFATLRNALNRHDVTNDSTTYYYGAPRTIEVGVKHSF